MVGIHRKVTQLLKFIQKYAPVLNNVIPGLGSIIKTGASIGEGMANGVNNVYNDYQDAKKKGTKYKILDGIKSFVSPAAQKSDISSKVIRPPAAMTSLTKTYGDLHPRVKLKSESGVEEVD
jgi:hypothetical protein